MTTETIQFMTPDQLDKVKENYANHIVDGMDMDDLWTFAVETLLHNMEMWDEQDLKEEVVDLYGEDIWQDFWQDLSEGV